MASIASAHEINVFGCAMNKICDLYLPVESRSVDIRLLKLFDAGFSYDAEHAYSGFMNVNVSRVKLVSVVSELRKKGVLSVSVPVEYRDGEVVDVREAMGIAEEYAKSIGCSIGGASPRSGYAPLFWAFDIVRELGRADKAGGVVMVDRLDGHVWTMAEYEEYMYDYNNVF
ncbi:hypothetical protein [Burkholderia multivorans]|uniref:hypothetical protein n=1 Tax=Burkholderia multivorans TaxID=87883 RepID=UPI001C22558F|nr:hypothetical protein [Burkholderia multivorans]MBU9456439.1 hypothetical protein [Burkholderia multivorans]